MKYYTELISTPLAEKLKEKGMPMIYRQSYLNDEGVPTTLYGQVFDWLLERGISCEITRYIDYAHEEVCPEWDWSIEKVGPIIDAPGGYSNTWHKAAEAAIEKALELIK